MADRLAAADEAVAVGSDHTLDRTHTEVDSRVASCRKVEVGANYC